MLGLCGSGPFVPAASETVVEGMFVANDESRVPSRGEAVGGDKNLVGEGTAIIGTTKWPNLTNTLDESR